MHKEFDQRNMLEVQVILLTHKMKCVFQAEDFFHQVITPEIICEAVKKSGFECEHLQTNQITQQKNSNLAQKIDNSMEEPDLDNGLEN